MSLIEYNHIKHLIPSDWTTIINHTTGDKFSSFIAGGCLRDLDLGATLKDIDVYLCPNEEDTEITKELVDEVIQGFKYYLKSDIEIKTKTEWGEQRKYGRLRVVHVVEVKWKGLTVEFIYNNWRNNLEDVLDDFDLGICKIGYDGTNVLVDEGYIRDKSCKTITITKGSSFNDKKWWDHLNRVAAKYPDYRII